MSKVSIVRSHQRELLVRGRAISSLCKRIILTCLCYLAIPSLLAATLPPLAFPEAEGFGKYTQGGRGGKVFVVNTLSDNPDSPEPGSLRYAVIQKEPRIVVFSVSGVIHLQAPLVIKHDYITLAGQSSPGGIVISGAETEIKANQVIIRYLRFRPGSAQSQGDALTARRHRDIIIDHCSLSWANDEVASFYNNQNFTLQYSIISESLNNAGHAKGEHGYGGIWGGSHASFVHNLMAHHHSRNPRINGYRLGAPYAQTEELTDVRNNVFYNWGGQSGYGGEAGRFNLVNNYYLPGPASKPKRFFQLWGEGDSLTRAFIHGNVMHGETQKSGNNLLGIEIKNAKKLGAEQRQKIFRQSLVSEPFWFMSEFFVMSDETAKQSYHRLIEQAEIGANRNRNGKFMDSVDQRLLQQIITRKVGTGNGIIDSELQVISSWQAYQAEFIPDEAEVSIPSSEQMQLWLDKIGAF